MKNGARNQRESPGSSGDTPGLGPHPCGLEEWFSGTEAAEQLTSGGRTIKFMGLSWWSSLGRIPESQRTEGGRRAPRPGAHSCQRPARRRVQTRRRASPSSPGDGGEAIAEPDQGHRPARAHGKKQAALCSPPPHEAPPSTLLPQLVLSQAQRRGQSPVQADAA